LAIRGDEELNKLLSCVTIASGGVIPNIHSVLLPKKKEENGEDSSLSMAPLEASLPTLATPPSSSSSGLPDEKSSSSCSSSSVISSSSQSVSPCKGGRKGYSLFAKEKRDGVRKAHSSEPFTEHNRILGRMWKELTEEEREAYHNRAQEGNSSFSEE
jgi:hypothetical protein